MGLGGVYAAPALLYQNSWTTLACSVLWLFSPDLSSKTIMRVIHVVWLLCLKFIKTSRCSLSLAHLTWSQNLDQELHVLRRFNWLEILPLQPYVCLKTQGRYWNNLWTSAFPGWLGISRGESSAFEIGTQIRDNLSFWALLLISILDISKPTWNTAWSAAFIFQKDRQLQGCSCPSVSKYCIRLGWSVVLLSPGSTKDDAAI